MYGNVEFCAPITLVGGNHCRSQDWDHTYPDERFLYVNIYLYILFVCHIYIYMFCVYFHNLDLSTIEQRYDCVEELTEKEGLFHNLRTGIIDKDFSFYTSYFISCLNMFNSIHNMILTSYLLQRYLCFSFCSL